MQLLWKEVALTETYSWFFMRKTGEGILLCGEEFFLSKPPTSFTRCVLHLYLHTLSYTHTHTLSHSLNPFFPTPAALERLEEVMVHQLSVSCMDQTQPGLLPRASPVPGTLSLCPKPMARTLGQNWELGPGPRAGLCRPEPPLAGAVLAQRDLWRVSFDWQMSFTSTWRSCSAQHRALLCSMGLPRVWGHSNLQLPAGWQPTETSLFW